MKIIPLKGSYDCICREGFDLINDICSDIDECLQEKHDCSKNELCVNNFGSFKCECKEGLTDLLFNSMLKSPSRNY